MNFPEIDPVALALGPIAIRWYGLAYFVGILLALARALRLVQSYPDLLLSKQAVERFVVWATVGIIVGGRLGSILLYNPAYYAAHPDKVLAFSEGGMSFHGGLLGVAMACLVFGWRTGAPILRLGDLLACVAPIGLFLGRLANFINGELWGRPTVLPWGVIFPDPRAGAVPRHPSQLYEAALEGFLLFAVLNLLARSSRVRSRAGLLTATFLLGYGVARTLVELTREPDASLFGPFTRGQAYSLPMLASGLVLLLLALRSPPDTHRSSPASHAG